MPRHTRLVPFFCFFFGPAYRTSLSWCNQTGTPPLLFFQGILLTQNSGHHAWLDVMSLFSERFIWLVHTDKRGGKSFEKPAAERHFEVFYFLVTLTTVWYSCYVQGLGGGNPGATQEWDSPLPIPQAQPGVKHSLKVSFKNTSHTQTDMLTEERPQELARAGFYAPAFEAGTNQLPGQPTIKHTCSQSHTHTRVEEGYLRRGNEKHIKQKCPYDRWGCNKQTNSCSSGNEPSVYITSKIA